MSADAEVIDRLDRIITLMEIGFGDAIGRLRAEVRSDPVSAAVLDSTRQGWVSSGDVKRQVSKVAKVSEKTVQRSLAALVDRGVLRVRGTGPSVNYRSTGIL